MRRLRLKFSIDGDVVVNEMEPCILLGSFPSLEICEAAFTTGINASMDYKQSLLFLRCSTATITDSAADIPVPGGTAVAGIVSGVSSLWRRGKEVPSWCLSLKTFVQAKGSNEPTEKTIHVLMKGLLRYRWLVRLGAKLKLIGINRIKYDGSIDAYAAADGASLITRYEHPAEYRELRLRVIQFKNACLVCSGVDNHCFTLDVSDWSPNQRERIGPGCELSVGNAFTVGKRALALCRHSNVILEEASDSAVEARELQTALGCGLHRSVEFWGTLRTGKSCDLRCAVVQAQPSIASLISDCHCFDTICDSLSLGSPPLVLLAESDGLIEDTVSGVLTQNMRVADLSHPLGIPLACLNLPDLPVDSVVKLDRPLFRSGCILLRGKAIAPIPGQMIVTRLHADTRSIRGYLLGGGRLKFDNISPDVFFQLEPLCWVSIANDGGVMRARKPNASREALITTVQASTEVVRCKSIAEASRLKTGLVFFLESVIVVRISSFAAVKGSKSLLLKNADSELSCMTVTSPNDPAGTTLTVVAASNSCRGIATPFACDIFEVCMDHKPNSEPTAVVLQGGRIAVRLPAVPDTLMATCFSSDGLLVSLNSIKAYLACKACKAIKYPLVQCSCQAEYSTSLSVSFTAQICRRAKQFEVNDSVAIQLLHAVKGPLNFLDALERHGGVFMIEEDFKVEPARQIQLSHGINGKVDKLSLLSRETEIKRKLG